MNRMAQKFVRNFSSSTLECCVYLVRSTLGRFFSVLGTAGSDVTRHWNVGVKILACLPFSSWTQT